MSEPLPKTPFVTHTIMQSPFPLPRGGASLILSFRLQTKSTLILGSGPVAAARAFSALEADSTVVVLTKGGLASACEELQWRAQHGQLTILDLDTLPGSSMALSDVAAIESYLTTSNGIRLVCITDTVLGTPPSQRRTRASASQICTLCNARNIPVNVTDIPDLCDFSFTSTHRFDDPETGGPSALQIGVTTNGQGCRLGGRIRREIVARLPKDVGAAVGKVGKLRALAKEAGVAVDDMVEIIPDSEPTEDSSVTTPNCPVPLRNNTETALESVMRRLKWVAQVSEYWPLPRLARMTDEEMVGVLSSGEDIKVVSAKLPESPHLENAIPNSMHSLALKPPPGRIFLVGAGPGHPSLLTIATHTALTRHANLVLSDKLVPAAVLALIPPEVEVRIARKFPGNAEGAQNEMMKAAVEAAQKGLTVVRLKQGDPVVYGRAGEEVLYFRSHGFEPLVIPGVSSALAGPMFAGIPVTQRGVAESFVVCTGVGRQGKEVQLPGYERGRTLVILMGVARLTQVVEALTESGPWTPRRGGPAYPAHLPIALIERASMSDQRVISSMLRNIIAALEGVGEQRPPGMLVVGWAVLALWGKGDVAVLEDGAEAGDEERVRRWLGEQGATGWMVHEGLNDGWEGLI